MGEWIKCIDRTPHEGQDVIIFSDGHVMDSIKFINGDFYHCGWGRGELIRQYPVLYWQPLPEPPHD